MRLYYLRPNPWDPVIITREEIDPWWCATPARRFSLWDKLRFILGLESEA